MNIFRFLLILIFPLQVLSADNCLNEKSKLQKGLELYNESQYLLSSIHFLSADTLTCSDSEITDRANLGYLYSIHQLGERPEAFRLSTILIQKLSPISNLKLNAFRSFYYDIKSTPEFENRKIKFQDWKLQLPQPKNPWIAGGLSTIIPGAGQVYTGAYQSAAVAFTLNVLFYSATLELQRKGLQSTSLASGLVLSIVYFGNIFNAANSSKIYNENYNRSNTEDYIKSNFPELSP